VLEGYRCSVDKKPCANLVWPSTSITEVRAFACALGLPTDSSHVAASPPLTHCDLTTVVESSYSGY